MIELNTKEHEVINALQASPNGYLSRKAITAQCPSIDAIAAAETILHGLGEQNIVRKDGNGMYRLLKSSPAVTGITTKEVPAPKADTLKNASKAKPTPTQDNIMDGIPTFLKQPEDARPSDPSSFSHKVFSTVNTDAFEEMAREAVEKMPDAFKQQDETVQKLMRGAISNPQGWPHTEPTARKEPQASAPPAVITETLRAIGDAPYTITITITSDDCTLEYKGNQS